MFISPLSLVLRYGLEYDKQIRKYEDDLEIGRFNKVSEYWEEAKLEGISRICQAMEKSMLSIPEYNETNGNVYLTLRNYIR
jgi:hypothetical protein